MNRRFTLGFTLVELLVVIAIIGVLVALLLPAVQSAREAARRASCCNNLTQIGLALHNYEMAHGAYPPGTTDKSGPIMNTTAGYHHNWIEHILPYMEEQNAFNAIDQSVSVYDPKNAPVVTHMPRWLSCPSNGAGRGFACYAACHHDKEKPIDARDKGVFFLNSGVRYEDITDGSSHTLFVGEKLPDAWDLNWLSGTRATLRNTGVPINWLTPRNGLPSPGGATQPPPLNKLPNLETDDDVENSSGPAPPAVEPAGAGVVNTVAQPTPAPADPIEAPPAAPPPGPAKATLLSMPGSPGFVGGFGGSHPGGVNVAMGDSSVRFMSQNISRQVLQGLANRSDGKLPDSDF